MNLVDGLHSVKVINTRIETDLVHHDDPSRLSLGIKLPHGGGYITSSDDVGLPFNGRLDDRCVMSIRNERNDEIVCGDLSIQVWRVCIEGDGFRGGKTGC